MAITPKLPPAHKGLIVDETLERCASIVRGNDYDRFLTALTASPDARGKLMALYAFNAELGRILDTVSEPAMAAIRFQWWRDAIERLSPLSSDHPALPGLFHILEQHQVTASDLESLIDAHEDEFEGVSHDTWDDLDRYCDLRAGGLMRLALRIVGNDEGADNFLTNAGRAWGIMSLVRVFPHHAGQGRLYFPAEAFADVDLDPHGVFRGEGGMPLMGILLGAIGRAEDYLAFARQDAKQAPKALRPAFVYVSFVDLYAAQIRRHPAEPFALHPQVPSFQKQWKMMMRGFGGGL